MREEAGCGRLCDWATDRLCPPPVSAVSTTGSVVILIILARTGRLTRQGKANIGILTPHEGVAKAEEEPTTVEKNEGIKACLVWCCSAFGVSAGSW